MLTGRVPIWAIFWPLTVWGITCDGRRLSWWSPGSFRISVLAVEMFAPESGGASMVDEPLGFYTPTAILGTVLMDPECVMEALSFVGMLGWEVGTDMALAYGSPSKWFGQWVCVIYAGKIVIL